MQPGDYRALYVDPWSGKPLGSRGFRCGAAGADLELPDFSRDIAIALAPTGDFDEPSTGEAAIPTIGAEVLAGCREPHD